MSVQRIASRYAKSLLDLAVEQQKLERIKEDVEVFLAATKVRPFYLLLKSPIVHKDKKGAVLDALFKDKFDELTMAFLKILLTKSREAYLPEIARAFLAQYKAVKHISEVKVISAVALSEATLEAIRKQLEQSPYTDERVELIAEVDPELIGGFVLEFDDLMYDASVKHKLELLAKEFRDNEYVSQIFAS